MILVAFQDVSEGFRDFRVVSKGYQGVSGRSRSFTGELQRFQLCSRGLSVNSPRVIQEAEGGRDSRDVVVDFRIVSQVLKRFKGHFRTFQSVPEVQESTKSLSGGSWMFQGCIWYVLWD